MEVVKVVWWQHNCPNGQASSAKVHRSLNVSVPEEGNVVVSCAEVKGLKPEIIDGY
jgi:CRISPR-associated protein Csd2